jgi:hypothetical protein
MPLTLVAQPPTPTVQTWEVKVEALGQKNARSQGDEVWIYEIRTPTEVLEWKNAQQSAPRWDLVPRPNAAGGFAALATGGSHRELIATLRGESLSIKLIKHAWSGLARVTVNGKTRTLDLYSAADPVLDTVIFGAARVAAVDGAIHTGADVWIYEAALLVFLIAAGVLWLWNSRRRRTVIPEPFATREVPLWLRAGSRRAVISALLAVPTSVALLHPLFGPPTAGGLQVLLTYLYSTGLWYGTLTFWWLWRRPEDRLQNCPNGTPGTGYCIVAALLSAGAATLIVAVAENSLNAQHAYWAKVTIRTDALRPPQLAVRYGPAPKEVSSLQWQPYSQTIVTLRRQVSLTLQTPVRVEQIVADDRPVDPGDLAIQGGIHDARVVSIAAPYGGMFRWSATAARVSFLVSGGAETVQFFWLDQSRTVQLGPAPQSVSFDIGGRYQGWALLPPQEIDSLRVVPIAVMPGSYAIRAQVLAPSVPAADLGTLRFESPSKVVSLPLAAPMNRRRPAVLAAAWLSLWLGGMLAVWALYRCSVALASRPRQRLRWVGSTAVAGSSPGGSGFAYPALAVWIVCAAYHLTFALSVRTAFTGDSIGYYAMAKQLLGAPYLQSVVIARTPAYPLFLSWILGLSGDTVIGIAVLQHLALASLSVIAMWCLWDKLPRKWVCVAGLAVGVAPCIAPTGNVLWTESLFCVFGSSALLFFSCYRRRSAYLFLAGICGGIATMLRPNGLLVVAVMLGAVVVRFLWSCGAVSWRTLAASGAGLIGGYLMVAAPWHMHLAVNRGTFALGKGLAEFGTWAGYVFEGRLPVELPINAPNRAVFADPMAYRNEPYIALASFPLLMGDDASVYYRETKSEWLASESWAPHWETLKFHATLVWDPAKLLVAFEEIRGMLEGWRQLPSLAGQASGVESVLIRLTSARPPGPPQAGMLWMVLSTFELNHWGWMALLALGGGAASCFAKPWLTPLLLYVTGSILAFSTNLVPGERYIVVLEPLCYILAIAFIHTLWLWATFGNRSLAHDVRNRNNAAPAAIRR